MTDPHEYPCTECGTRYCTPSAAETCAEQDELESKQTRSAHRRKNRHHID